MKKLVFAVAAAAFLFTLPSCKKCSTCKYTFNDGSGTSTYTYPEQCGNKKDIDAYEKACETGAASVGGSCSCDKS